MVRFLSIGRLVKDQGPGRTRNFGTDRRAGALDCRGAGGKTFSDVARYRAAERPDRRCPIVVGEALSVLRKAGVAGPYGIALGPRCYAGLTRR
jgi:hypothetical protein